MRKRRLVVYALLGSLFFAFSAKAQTTGHYGHMFSPGPVPDQSYIDKMGTLGRSLLAKDRAPSCDCSFTPKEAGYTYFGQFIDHDLTFDPVPLEQASRWKAEDIKNGRTPWLDLDQVYGGGPSRSPELYEVGQLDAEHFKIAGKDLPPGRPYKLLGDQSLPIKERDFRDLENAIILQLHVLFMRLHNLALDRNLSIPEFDDIDKTPFKKAARFVRWQYQYLVRKDYLPKIVDGTILSKVQTEGPAFKWDADKFFIPVEFSTAAFRFGHSAVREKYQLNRGNSRNVGQLIEPKFSTHPLPRELLIEWKHFFPIDDGSEVETTEMASIDTRITPDLGDLKQYTTRIFSHDPLLDPRARNLRADPAELPVRTLVRGAWMRVASAQTVIRELGVKQQELKEEQLDGRRSCKDERPDKSGQVLRDQGLLGNTPLFYYVLREAEILGCGDHLGPVGSHIVADVIEGAFRFDPDSKWELRDKWQPPNLDFPSGDTRPIEFMADLVELVGK